MGSYWISQENRVRRNPGREEARKMKPVNWVCSPIVKS